jgi:hypothetical protein
MRQGVLSRLDENTVHAHADLKQYQWNEEQKDKLRRLFTTLKLTRDVITSMAIPEEGDENATLDEDFARAMLDTHNALVAAQWVTGDIQALEHIRGWLQQLSDTFEMDIHTISPGWSHLLKVAAGPSGEGIFGQMDYSPYGCIDPVA